MDTPDVAALQIPPARPTPVTVGQTDLDAYERISARLNTIRHGAATGKLTLPDLDWHLRGVADKVLMFMRQMAEETAGSVPTPEPESESAGDAELDQRIADLRERYNAGELDLDQVMAATQELAAEITPDPAPVPTAATAPPALGSFLLSVQTLAKAVDICITAYLEGRLNGQREG